PKQMKNNGLKDGELTVGDDALRATIRLYTREAGVRSLERLMSKLCRKVVKQLLSKDGGSSVTVTEENLDKYLGVPQFRYGRAEETNQVGQVTGLAWTEVGGELLTIEAALAPGKGKLTQTGSLGNVMQESIQAALTVVRSRSKALGIDPKFAETQDIHVHVPEGATPKDGPSAGIAMCTALVSALTNIPVRADVAMTGEITLRGEVLPIGGLKEKLLAAQRGGIQTVVIPRDNVKDLADIPETVKSTLNIEPVRWIEDVLKFALERQPEPRPEEPAPVAADPSKAEARAH
ncbi:MAG TPA: S16 family serine protease, partial [Solimonas sp.]|nr:S16 family serine protease [Solimonas sp.]